MYTHTLMLHGVVSVRSQAELDSFCPHLNRFDHIGLGVNLVFGEQFLPAMQIGCIISFYDNELGPVSLLSQVYLKVV